MPATSLSASETKSRFSVEKAIENFPSDITEEEEKYVKTVLQYMEIAYSPEKNTGGDSVKHLQTENSTFEARSTFPDAHTPAEYAESHSHVMSSLRDLHIKSFQIVNVRENLISLRYTATGSHIGDDHNGIEATKQRGEWTGAGNFIIDETTGLIKHWWKDWDKNQMWDQLGWVRMKDEKHVDFV